ECPWISRRNTPEFAVNLYTGRDRTSGCEQRQISRSSRLSLARARKWPPEQGGDLFRGREARTENRGTDSQRGSTNATPSRAHFHPSLWLSESHDLLVAQSHNRVDPRGSPRRHIASDCGDHHDYAERYEVHGDVAGVDSKEERLVNARQTIRD